MLVACLRYLRPHLFAILVRVHGNAIVAIGKAWCFQIHNVCELLVVATNRDHQRSNAFALRTNPYLPRSDSPESSQIPPRPNHTIRTHTRKTRSVLRLGGSLPIQRTHKSYQYCTHTQRCQQNPHPLSASRIDTVGVVGLGALAFVILAHSASSCFNASAPLTKHHPVRSTAAVADQRHARRPSPHQT